MEEENKKDTTKWLAAAVIILSVLFAVQTFYILHLKNAKPEFSDKTYARGESGGAGHPVSRSYRIMKALPQAQAVQADGREEWDPFMEMERMQDLMNHMFRDSFRRAGNLGALTGAGWGNAFFEPDADIQDAGNKYIVKLDLPGMDKDKIKVDVTDHALTVSGERKVENESNNPNFYTMERSYGSFSRQIPLPSDADPANMTAKYENGVLTVEVLKLKQEAGSKPQKTVPIQ